MAENRLSAQVGHRISLPGHFDVPVILEDARPLDTDRSAGYECRVRLPDGALEEAVISSEEAATIFGAEEEEKVAAQPRLRFLLADDPGAGKTIMVGLLIKELKLREAIDRCLILVPAPLTIQWQDELLRFFNEPFQMIHSANDQQQLLNLWERESQVVSSIDYAKQDDVRERVWQQRWDLIIIDDLAVRQRPDVVP